MRTTLAAVNQELARRGRVERLARASGYFYFRFGEAAEWLDRTVATERVSDLSVEEWLGEFERLLALNRKLREEARPKKDRPRAKRAGKTE
jgi:hypothetical protein